MGALLGHRGLMLGADPDAVIRAAFAGGEDGIWIAPRLGGMFQDSALATPWTADGQPVGGYVDRSPNAYTLTQATTTARPLGYGEGVDFDGADDYLHGAAEMNLRLGGYFAVTVVTPHAVGGSTRYFAAKQQSGSGRYAEGISGSSSALSSVVLADGANSAVGGTITAGTKVVLSAAMDRVAGSGGKIVQRINGVQVGENGFLADASDYQPSGDFVLGAFASMVTAFFDGVVHERVQIMRAPASGEIEAIEARLAAVHGIAL